MTVLQVLLFSNDIFDTLLLVCVNALSYNILLVSDEMLKSVFFVFYSSGLFASQYKETHYGVDGQIVTTAHNSTVC